MIELGAQKSAPPAMCLLVLALASTTLVPPPTAVPRSPPTPLHLLRRRCSATQPRLSAAHGLIARSAWLAAPRRSPRLGLAAPTAPAALPPPVVTRPFSLRVISALVGTIGAFTLIFSWHERWPLLDALYFTATTLATIGFGDLRPHGGVGRSLTLLVGVCGVGLLGGLVSATLAEWLRQSAGPAEAAGGLRREVLQLVLLVAVGVAGFRGCEGRHVSWATAAYFIIGSLTTAGLGERPPTDSAASLCTKPQSRTAAKLATPRTRQATWCRPLSRPRPSSPCMRPSRPSPLRAASARSRFGPSRPAAAAMGGL